MYRRIIILFSLFFILPLLFIGISFVDAQTETERLQEQISERNNRLTEIEAEISKFESALLEVGAEKNTLKSAIQRLSLERGRVLADLKLTKNKIGTTDLEIDSLSLEISETEIDIGKNKNAIKEILRAINSTDNSSLIEALLRYDNLSEFWGTIDELETVKTAMGKQVAELLTFKTQLEENKNFSEINRKELITLKTQYDDQQQVLQNNKTTKDKLLLQTVNEEDNYQTLLAQKQSAREQMLREIREYESQLQFILDPNAIPKPGTAVFNWPLVNPYITQHFGGTEFAKRNAELYGGRPYHPGIDIGAPRGTKILAPLTGTVRATGNTDAVPGCLSWGKWTLVDHANGLSTLYAHQDLINVVPGQQVKTGEVIGYVGSTGFSTGPHLHFTVYVKEAVQVHKFNEIKSVTSCGSASSPFAATDAYLDPMIYLPPL